MRARLATLLVLLSACAAPERLAHHRSPLLEAPDSPLTPEGRPNAVPLAGPRLADGFAVEGAALAATASSFLGRRSLSVDGRRFPDDCTGLVRAVYARHGVDVMAEGTRGNENGVTAIYRFASRRGTVHQSAPKPGDIVFFRETYDRNRDGRENDGLTHVGIVEALDPDGTVQVIHRVARGVVRYRMNPSLPHRRTDDRGRVVNDWLREGKRTRLTGELFAGYGSLAR